MRVLVTGAGGFIGRALVRAIAERGRLVGAGGRTEAIDELVLVDRALPDEPATAALPVRQIVGDLRDADVLAQAIDSAPDSVFHLAATLTIDAERDPQTGWAINMQLPVRMLDALGATGRRPRFVYASSIAVFGGTLPAVVGDAQYRTPRTSYGTAKAIVELLIDDYSRRGLVDGRALRLPIVLIRPPAATRTVSDIVASIARDPLLGQPVVAPLGAALRFPVVSVQRVAANLLRLHDVPSDRFGDSRAVNQPGLSIGIDDIVAALGRVGGPAAAARVSVAPDAALEAVVRGWPAAFVSTAPIEPPLEPDADVDAILRAWLAERSG